MDDAKRAVLAELSFGHRVAEEEADELAKYFVETEQWRQLRAGRADIVYGLKGSGKSALYATLVGEKAVLESEGVDLVSAENPRGATAFRGLADHPPTSEWEFRALWKLYFLQLISSHLREHRCDSSEAKRCVQVLEDAGLLPREGLRAVLASAQAFIRQFKPAGVETGLKLDPFTGMVVGVTGKLLLGEPTASQRANGLVGLDELFNSANTALEKAGRRVWLLLDRLDVAFLGSEELETNALRALFYVYLDLRTASHVSLKIFLRSDIWDRITESGFREGSHITRYIRIEWDSQSLLNLVVRRIVQVDHVCIYYKVTATEVLGDAESQKRLFYRVFPPKIDPGEKRPVTFDWILSRTRDGSLKTAPRELIHLMAESRDLQLRRTDLGQALPEGEQLISGGTVKDALLEVSQARLSQTLFAEYPPLKPYVEKLRRAKTQQSIASLAIIWKEGKTRATETAEALFRVGFFERRGSRDDPEYWVPFLYRDALEMTQGASD